MKVGDALRDVALLYVDTAPFIYYTENRAGYVEKMRAIFLHILDGQSDIITSTITLSECLTKPLKENDAPLVKAYNTFFQNTRGITLFPVDASTARQSARLRARYNLRTPDALHIATALETGCQAFLTNDLAIKRVSEISVLVLDELVIDTSPEN